MGASSSQPYADDLRLTVERATTALLAVPEAATAIAPAPGKWSPREVIGHLVDSASNNHQRFVRAPFMDSLVFDGYDQDAWVRTQRYGEASWPDLVGLWRSMNLHLARVMGALPADVRTRVHTTHNLDRIAWRTVPAGQPATLDYFMADYVGHLHHHLRQVLGDRWNAPAVTTRAAAFRRLHESGCFVLLNPWDAGSARLLAGMGFSALATTSSGMAWSSGRADNHVSLPDVLAHVRTICGAVTVPVSADLEHGFAVTPEGVAANVTLAITTGIAGFSIEDSTGDPVDPLFGFELAVDRIRAAREAIERSGTGVVLTARAEGFLVGQPNLDDVIRRLSAFARAGADCVYAPGLTTMDDIGRMVQAVAPTPVNVLVGRDFTTVAQLAALGVRRISVGGALARASWAGFLTAAREIAEHGTFHGLADAVPFAEIDGAFRE
jgi:2-methylisocitrate lyase-like PEP mutase family enzyme